MVFLVIFIYIFHPIHISITDIIYNQEEKRLEITQKIFIDDLEKVIYEKTGKKLFIDTEKEISGVDNYIHSYIIENLYISVNQQIVKLEYVGREIENDIIWIYWQVKKIRKIKVLQVENTCFLSLYPDQKNILNTSLPNKKKTVLLNYFTSSIEIKNIN